MLVSVLGYSECGEELCLPLVLWCLASEAEVTLASVLGCSACGEDLCLTLRAMVPGLGGRSDASFGARLLGMNSSALSLRCCYGAWLGSGGDASLGARLLGMRSSVLANAHSLQCRGDASCGVRMLGMKSRAVSLLCCCGAWLGRRR